jgi:octaprenyl-diphosphate synthase
MNQYKTEALLLLEQFPESEIKNGFRDLVNFVTERKY